MKKTISLSLIAASTLLAASVPVTTGWNLIGAVDNIDPSNIDCVKTAWVYDASDTTGNPWRLYTNTNAGYNTPDVYGYSSISTVTQGQGFWLNSSCDTSVDFNSTTSTTPTYFSMFNLNWEDVKKDTRYTTVGNSIVPSSTFATLTTSKSDNQESRTEMATYLSSPVMGANASLKLTDSSTGYNKVQFRVHCDTTMADGSNVRTYSVIGITGKKIFAYTVVDDGTTETKVFDSQTNYSEDAMYYDSATSSLIGKDITVSIQNNNGTIGFSAVSSGLTIGTVSFTPPTGTVTSGIDTIKVRTSIDDYTANSLGEEAGASVSADVYNVSVATAVNNDLNITTASASPVSLSTLTNAINFESDDSHWYSIFTKEGTSFSVEDYDYNGTWNLEESFTGTISVDTTDDTQAAISFTDGFAANFKVNSTEQITSINGVTYSDLYISDTNITVTALGSPWTNTWDWMPQDSNGTQITTMQEFKEEALVGNMYFMDQAMLDGVAGDISGILVEGDCVYNTEYNHDECTKTDIQIGTWSYDSTLDSLTLDTTQETETLTLVNGYIHVEGQDKIGSVWNEKMLTGTDATADIVKQLITK